MRELDPTARLSKLASLYGDLTMGAASRIDDFCVLSGRIVVGRHVHIGCACSLIGDIELEDFAGLSGGVRLYARSDDYSGEHMTNPTVPAAYTQVHQAPIRIGRHAIIGANSVILPGVTIGEGAAVGAQALITRDVAPWSVVAGKGLVVGERSRRLLELEQQLILLEQQLIEQGVC